MNLREMWQSAAALLIVFGLLACQEEKKADNSCQADTDCKNGTLCEGGMCIPAEVAKKARAADSDEEKKAEKATEPTKEKAAEEAKEEEGPVPLIPKEQSNPPKLPDWEKAAEINTQHEHGLAKECSMKVVREWVRVFCRGDILGYQDMREFGKKNVDYYVSVKEKTLSFVGRIKQGPKQSLRICRKDDRASLAIHWPMDKDRPEHIALGDGKACENTEYETGKDEDKFEPPPGQDEELNLREDDGPINATCAELGCAQGKYAGEKTADCKGTCPSPYTCMPFGNEMRCTCQFDCPY